ncbi:MHYT domain-containing protein [Mesorhizobium sp. ZMM04-5]|uniref:MHYT domain-containing protein n=1 Tax=Mesorhizobium marinum TaxID=3228790 RepID=A0ABV3R3L3_9HYPH
MFIGHNPYLVALSVVIAILGGYTGFGLAARLRGAAHASRRVLLAGAACFLAVGIWTMHFVGMLAAPLPPDASYLILPTVVSFLICALVVGVSLFFVGIGDPSSTRLISSAVLLGIGVVSMHYVGIHGLQGDFRLEHEQAMIALAALIAVGTAYGGLRIFLARHGGARLALSAVAFGLAVSGMHYTAMYGMRFIPGEGHDGHAMGGLVASSQVLALIVALLCFLIIAGFLLFLVPDPRPRAQMVHGGGQGVLPGETVAVGSSDGDTGGAAIASFRAHPMNKTLPLGGAGQPRPTHAARLPVESADGTHFVDAADIRSIKADAHYTLVRDGSRERMCTWSISEAEAQLDPGSFMRVHRSHIVAIPHVTLIRREGDGAVVELDGPTRHLVPVSRARIAELKARLGLLRRQA